MYQQKLITDSYALEAGFAWRNTESIDKSKVQWLLNASTLEEPYIPVYWQSNPAQTLLLKRISTSLMKSIPNCRFMIILKEKGLY